MNRYSNIAKLQLRRLLWIGAVIAVCVALLLRERLNVIEVAILLFGTTLVEVLLPNRTDKALLKANRNPRTNWADFRASPIRGILRACLIILLASWAVTAGTVLVAYVGSISISISSSSAVSGAVLLVVSLQVALAVWLWTQKRRNT